MTDIEIPPDATAFKVKGKSLFLYFGPLEMVRLQREWGLIREKDDSAADWEQKNQTFQQRCLGAVMDDKLSMFRIALGRCIKEYAKSDAPLEVTDNDSTAELLSGLEGKGAPLFRVQALFLQLMVDSFGFKPDAEDAGETADPKVLENEEGSTPSSS